MLHFGARTFLMIRKLTTKKMGFLVVPQIHLKEVQTSGFFYVKERKMGGARGD